MEVCVAGSGGRTLCACCDGDGGGVGRRGKRGKSAGGLGIGPLTFASKRKFLTDSCVVVEYHQCVECNTRRKEIMALRGLMRDVEGDGLLKVARREASRRGGSCVGCLTIRRKDSGVGVEMEVEKLPGCGDEGCRCGAVAVAGRKVLRGGRCCRKAVESGKQS